MFFLTLVFTNSGLTANSLSTENWWTFCAIPSINKLIVDQAKGLYFIIETEERTDPYELTKDGLQHFTKKMETWALS